MKTLTLDQLAQSEFALNPSASLQVTGGADSENPIIRFAKEALKYIVMEELNKASQQITGYLYTVEINAPRIDCSDTSKPLDIMTGCHY